MIRPTPLPLIFSFSQLNDEVILVLIIVAITAATTESNFIIAV